MHPIQQWLSNPRADILNQWLVIARAKINVEVNEPSGAVRVLTAAIDESMAGGCMFFKLMVLFLCMLLDESLLKSVFQGEPTRTRELFEMELKTMNEYYATGWRYDGTQYVDNRDRVERSIPGFVSHMTGVYLLL